MSQCSIAEKVKSCFTVSKEYTSIDDDLLLYQFIPDINQDYAALVQRYSVLCANSEIRNRGDLCALTNSIIELDELKAELDAIDKAIIFPDLRSVCCDTNEVLEKIKFASTYHYPYINENNEILRDFFAFDDNESNYMKGYYLNNTLYTPEENKNDIKFRNIPEKEEYYRICGKVQEASYDCFKKTLKLNSDFNSYVIHELMQGEDVYHSDEHLKNAILLLETQENPFLDSGRLFQNTKSEFPEERDLGVRR